MFLKIWFANKMIFLYGKTQVQPRWIIWICSLTMTSHSSQPPPLPPPAVFWITTLDTGSGPSITRMRPADWRRRLRVPYATAWMSTCSWWRIAGLITSPWTLNRPQPSSRFWMQVRPEVLINWHDLFVFNAISNKKAVCYQSFLWNYISSCLLFSCNKDGRRDGSRPSHLRSAFWRGGRKGEGCIDVYRRWCFQKRGP